MLAGEPLQDAFPRGPLSLHNRRWVRLLSSEPPPCVKDLSRTPVEPAIEKTGEYPGSGEHAVGYGFVGYLPDIA